MKERSFSIFVHERGRPADDVLAEVLSALYPCNFVHTDGSWEPEWIALLDELRGGGDADSIRQAAAKLLKETTHLEIDDDCGIWVRGDNTDPYWVDWFETKLRWEKETNTFIVTYDIDEAADLLREVLGMVAAVVSDGYGENLTFKFGENPQGHAFSGLDALVHLAVQFKCARQPIGDGTFQLRPEFFRHVAGSMGYVTPESIVEN